MIDRVDEEKKLKWGFDFRAGRPVDGGGGCSGEGRSRYEWFPVADTDCVPSTYRRIGESWARGGADSDDGPSEERIIQGAVTGSSSLACSELAPAVADGGTSDVSIVSSANPRVGPDINEMNIVGEIGESSNASGSGENLQCLYCGTCDEGTPNDSFHVNPRSPGTLESGRFKAKDSSDADDSGFLL